jgi:hypothetical protein
MELVAPLPTELTALVDPAARGAAPLLRSVTKEGDGPVAAVPFGLFLELLAARAPAGQELPVAGKGLPVPLPASPPTAAPVATLPGPAQSLLKEVAASLRLDTAPSLASPPTSPSTAAVPPGPMLPLAPVVAPEGAQAPVAPPVAPIAEPVVPTAPTDLPAAPSGVDAPAVDPALDAPLPPAPRDLFATTADRRVRPPPVDVRAVTTSFASPATGAEPRAAAAPAEVAAPVLRVVQRDGRELTLRPVVAASEAASGTAPADWLPAATSQPAAHAAPTAHAAAAPAQAGLDLSSPDWREAFANRIQWLVDHRVGEAHLKLNPPELGAVDVKISLVDDQTFVQLTASTAGARDELSQSLPRLRELLIASGLDLGGATVQGGRDGRHEASGYANQAAAQRERDVFESGRHDEHTPSAPRRPAGRIDVFA